MILGCQRRWVLGLLPCGIVLLSHLGTLCVTAQAPASRQAMGKLGMPVISQDTSEPVLPAKEEPAESAPAPRILSRQPDRVMPQSSLRKYADIEKPLPINLPTALALANTRPLDIAFAAEGVRVAVAQLSQAQVLWLPNLQFGADYFRHDGRNQDATSGVIFDNDRSTLMIGGGPTAVFAITDAIFNPLAARQTVQAREATLRAASNDSLLAVAEAYFNIQQAKGDLFGAEEAVRKAAELVGDIAGLAPALVPELEITRAKTELARSQQVAKSAWERWHVASIDLTRILRVETSALIDPLEPAQIKITLVNPEVSLDDLIAIALTSRPELASQQALVQAALERWRQEKYRPFIPSVLMRGASTNPAGTLGAGVYGSGLDDSIGHFGMRLDYDVQVLWQLDNLGFGNAAKADERRGQHQLALVEFTKVQDRILAEVEQAQVQVRSARDRAELTEIELKEAQSSLEKNFEGLKQTKRAGNMVVLIVRPQEALASVQALGQAYADYFEAIADFNRAQFRLYRALGNPVNNPALGPGLDQACPAQDVGPQVLPLRQQPRY